jgi:hypothetical protein
MLFAAEVMSLLDSILKLLGPVIGIFVGWFWGQWQARSAWNKKEFTSNLILSLNIVKLNENPQEDEPVGSLQLRTLFEHKLEEIFANRVMTDIFLAAGKETTPTDPLMRFPKDDSWFLLNSILNKIAGHFSTGTLKAEMGQAVTKKWYTFCVTFEHDESMPQFKPRVLMIDREILQAFPETGTFQLESHHHEVRIDTLRLLKKEYKTHPHLFMDIELAI